MTLEQLIDNVRESRQRWEVTQAPDFLDQDEIEEAENDLGGDEIALVDYVLEHAYEFIKFDNSQLERIAREVKAPRISNDLTDNQQSS